MTKEKWCEFPHLFFIFSLSFFFLTSGDDNRMMKGFYIWVSIYIYIYILFLSLSLSLSLSFSLSLSLSLRSAGFPVSFLHSSVSLFRVCLSFCLFTCLSNFQFIYLSVCLFPLWTYYVYSNTITPSLTLRIPKLIVNIKCNSPLHKLGILYSW